MRLAVTFLSLSMSRSTAFSMLGTLLLQLIYESDYSNTKLSGQEGQPHRNAKPLSDSGLQSGFDRNALAGGMHRPSPQHQHRNLMSFGVREGL